MWLGLGACVCQHSVENINEQEATEFYNIFAATSLDAARAALQTAGFLVDGRLESESVRRLFGKYVLLVRDGGGNVIDPDFMKHAISEHWLFVRIGSGHVQYHPTQATVKAKAKPSARVARARDMARVFGSPPHAPAVSVDTRQDPVH